MTDDDDDDDDNDAAKIGQLLAEQRRTAERLDHIEQQLRLMADGALVQSAEPEPDDDFATENVVDASTASHRSGFSKPTIRRWVHDFSIGYKRGGRLFVSIPRLRRHTGDDR
ncbi:hypothetical protein [Rhizobium giardinii]|uniref:Uncharacterized protein n=1 Tax=Rhizobium giardinii TaxID=56731 RepID=A0A7W8X938_9HYPH|nr:hypothetical protein [Rhizobium giardinii]MBB5536839.1 hypothetical protein [Rhizobium giardinii]